VSLNAISFNGPTVLDTVLQPLVAIVLLWVMLRLPTHLARVAMLGAAPLGGGFMSRAVSYAAGSQVRDSARAHLPSWAGGHTTQRDAGGSSADSRTATRLRDATTLAGAAATVGTTAAVTRAASTAAGSAAAFSADSASPSGQASAAAGGGRSYAPPPTAQASAAGRGMQQGLQTPSFAGREQDFANELFEARYRERTSPVTGQQAAAALATLPAETQRAVAQLAADHGAGAREHLAYQALGEWSAPEREALRTLAAADPDVRQQAIDTTLGAASHSNARDAKSIDTAAVETLAHGAGEPGSVVSNVGADSPPTAPGEFTAATQSGWSHVDTTHTPPPSQPPTAPDVEQPAATAGNGAQHRPAATGSAPQAQGPAPAAAAPSPADDLTEPREQRGPSPDDPSGDH